MHPVPIYGQDHENKKGVELVTRLFLSCKTCLEKFLFWPDPLNLEIVERKRKNLQNIQYHKNEKSFLEEIKSIFHNFLRCFSFDKI